MILFRLVRHALWRARRWRFHRRLQRVPFKRLGVNVHIEPGYEFGSPENLEIGDDVYIGPYACISAIGRVVIGSGSILGP